MYLLISILIMLVTTFWMSAACYFLIRAEAAAIRVAANWLIPMVLLATGTLLYLLPHPVESGQPWPVVRAVHYGGIGVLFGFLIFGAICQWQIWTIFKANRNDSVAALAAIYGRWWAITKLLPAPAAFCILLSGLRLVYEDAARGVIADGSLFWLVVGFGFFFFDGLMFYLPEICVQYKAITSSKDLPEFMVNRKRRHEAMLFFHSISFPFVFFIGCVRPPLPFPSGLAVWLLSFVGRCSEDPDKVRVLSVALLIALIGIALFALRLPGLITHWKFLSRKTLHAPEDP